MRASNKPRPFDRMGDFLKEASMREVPSDAPAPGVGVVIEVDPRDCVMNDYHCRLDSGMHDAELQKLASSMSKGQITPAKGWRIVPADGHGPKYKLIYGARRRAAAELGGLKLLMELVDEPSARDLVLAMYGENAERVDYSAFEKGKEYLAYVESGAVRSLHELSGVIGEDVASISRCIQIAGLPDEVVTTYDGYASIPVMKGAKLASVIKDDKARERVLAHALKLRASGKTGDPTDEYLRVAAGLPPNDEPKQRPLQVGGKKIGSIIGGGEGERMVVTIKAGVADDLKKKIMEVLKG